MNDQPSGISVQFAAFHILHQEEESKNPASSTNQLGPAHAADQSAGHDVESDRPGSPPGESADITPFG